VSESLKTCRDHQHITSSASTTSPPLATSISSAKVDSRKQGTKGSRSKKQAAKDSIFEVRAKVAEDMWKANQRYEKNESCVPSQGWNWAVLYCIKLLGLVLLIRTK